MFYKIHLPVAIPECPFDASNFLSKHPGGGLAILAIAGKDA